MALKGRKFVIFGAFGSKTKAKRAEKKHPGSFVLRRKWRGHVRYIVLKPRRK
jgi:hypothetical protein